MLPIPFKIPAVCWMPGLQSQMLVLWCGAAQVLSIQRCQKVTDAPLVELAAGRCLKRLGINGVISITDATIIALATHCRCGASCPVPHH